MLTTYGMGVGGLSIGGFGVNVNDGQNNIVELIGIGALTTEAMRIRFRNTNLIGIGNLASQTNLIYGSSNVNIVGTGILSINIGETSWYTSHRKRRVRAKRTIKSRKKIRL